ncbi:MAG: hypothetical protein METHAR1v1_400009 [Methanothrix sp.]|nr:MAG: hypothetical protein METHAR1v1_400009 [Methanothrix sp.]
MRWWTDEDDAADPHQLGAFGGDGGVRSPVRRGGGDLGPVNPLTGVSLVCPGVWPRSGIGSGPGSPSGL